MRLRSPGHELAAALGDAIPGDHARQTGAESLVGGRSRRVLDLGCGAGDSVDLFRARDPDVSWTGVDIEGSREVAERMRDDARFVSFDGVSLPFEDGAFDLVYCKQVLEHVERPVELLTEVARVLAPDGQFVGSTSQLEPFHSMSTFGYTPYGFSLLLTQAGLSPVEIRPGIDGLTLMLHRLLGGGRVTPFWGRFWRRSPLNRVIDGYGRLGGMDARAVNANKLLFCGQFAFVARRAVDRLGGGVTSDG